MANPYFIPSTGRTFFDQFAKGIDVGLGLQGAILRAQQIEDALKTSAMAREQAQLEMERLRNRDRIAAELMKPSVAPTAGTTFEMPERGQSLLTPPGQTPFTAGVLEEQPPSLERMIAAAAIQGNQPATALGALRGQQEPQIIDVPGYGKIVSGGDFRQLKPLETTTGPRSLGELQTMSILRNSIDAVTGQIDWGKVSEQLQMGKTGEVVPNIAAIETFVASQGTLRPKGVPPGMTFEQGQEFLRQNTARRAQIQAAGVTAKGAAERQEPLGKDAGKWIHPGNLGAASPRMTEEEATEKGYRPFPGNAPQFVTASRGILNILDQWDELIKILPKSTGNPYGDLAMTALTAQKLKAEKRDPKVVKFFGLKRSQLPILARSMGDVANIAIAEQEFQAEAMPNEYDTYESAKAKLDSRRALAKGYIRSALGEPISERKGEGPARSNLGDLSNEELLKRLNQ